MAIGDIVGLIDLFKELLDSYEVFLGKRIDKNSNERIIGIFNNEIIKSLDETIEDDKFLINPYYGKKMWVNTPIIKISHKDFLGTNFYLGYIFKKDLSGFYLALFNKLNWDFKVKAYDFESNEHILKESMGKLRKNFSNEIFNHLTNKLDLKNKGLPRKYVDACILAKEYSNVSLSDENLKKDLDSFIDLYLFLAKNYDSHIISTEEWVRVLDSGIISSETMDLLKAINSSNGISTQKEISTNEFESKYIDYINEDFLINDLYEDSYDISNFLTKNILISEFGRNNFYNCFFYGRKFDDDLEFILRNELIEALNKGHDLKESLVVDIDDDSTDMENNGKSELEVDIEKPSFYEYLLDKGYYFDKEDIENFLLSIKVKPFVLLTGNSGTGKTKLAQLFSQYLDGYCRNDLVLEIPNDEFKDLDNEKSANNVLINENHFVNEERVISESNLKEYVDGICLDNLSNENKDTFLSNLKNLYEDLEELDIPDYTEGLYDEDYIEVKLDTKRFLNTYRDMKINFKLNDFIPSLPTENYQGRCNTFVNKIPVKSFFQLYPNIQYTSWDLYEYIKELYEKDPLKPIYIKFKREDIHNVMHMLPNWEGIYAKKIKLNQISKRFFFFTPYEVDKLLNLDGYRKYFDIKINNREFNVKFYIAFRVNFLKNTELENFIKEASNEYPNDEIDVHVDFDSFKYRVASIILTKSLPVSKFNNKKFFISPQDLNRFIPIKDISGIYPVLINDMCSVIRLNLNPFVQINDSSLDDYLKSLDSAHVLDLRFVLPKNYYGQSFDNQNKLPELNNETILDMELDANVFKESPLSLKNEDISEYLNTEYFEYFKLVVDGININSDLNFNLELYYLDENLKNYLSDLDNVNLNVFLDFEEFEEYISDFMDLDDDSNAAGEFGEDSSLIDELEDTYDKNLIYQIIPVGANWTENRHIIGYHNVITNKYQKTPAYDLVNISNKFYKDPHFLILDEMNLSHVERYFADFLSAIESGEKIPLYGEEELTLPSNLFIIGTVNVDETTYMFSPKVLDRANVIEFDTYSARDYMNNEINLTAPNGNISYLEDPLAGNEIRSYGIEELRNLFDEVEYEGNPFWNLLTSEIYDFQKILKESGFDFGFRVINEIVRFMAVAWEYDGKPNEFANWTRYFDACIKQKLLPKLHGSEKIIGETLDKLYAKSVGNHLTYETSKYPESARKLHEMREVLRKQRYVSFIN